MVLKKFQINVCTLTVKSTEKLFFIVTIFLLFKNNDEDIINSIKYHKKSGQYIKSSRMDQKLVVLSKSKQPSEQTQMKFALQKENVLKWHTRKQLASSSG